MSGKIGYRCAPTGLLFRGCLAMAAMGSACAAVAVAATGRERTQEAERLVQAALEQEAEGDAVWREHLLKRALEASDSYAPARWQSGHVQHQGRWIEAEAYREVWQNDRRRSAYQAMRAGAADTAESQRKLARWCAGRGLHAQARAHWSRVLELDSDHLEARSELGFRWIDGAWMSRVERAAAEAKAGRDRESIARWRPTLEKIAGRLQRGSRQQQAFALRQLAEINDPDAVVALEALVASLSEEAAGAVVESLSGMPGHESSLALARLAVAARWEAVRDAAVRALSDRRMEDFVPALLSAMHTPLQSRSEIYRAPGGRLVHRQMLFREGQEFGEISVRERAVRGRLPAALEEHLAQQAWRSRAGGQGGAATIEAENAATERINERITSVLSAVSGENHGADPAAWWDWWNEYNEVFVAGRKPTKQLFAADRLALASSRELPSLPELETPPPAPERTEPVAAAVSTPSVRTGFDCFAAGTPVWTSEGPVAIERIQVGDLVLAQDPHSGELAYKPVLRTTVRPPARLVQMTVAGETISSSGGHMLWQSGVGWTRSRDLRAGARLHALQGSVTLDATATGEVQPTYNLVVADFHTYFTGRARILSHDNTVCRPTDCTVPGLASR